MAHDADPRGDSHLASDVADVGGAPFSTLPVKGIAVKDFVPVHLAGSAGAAKIIGARSSLAKLKNACHFELKVPYVTGVRAAIRSSSPEFRRSPREDNERSSSVLTRYIQFPSDGSLLTESSVFREQRSLQRLAGHSPCGPGRAVLRRTKLRAQRSAMSELWKKPRRQRSLIGGAGVDAHARSEPPAHCMLLPEGDDELASINDTAFGARRSRFLREDIQPCASFVGISSSTADRYCCRDRTSSSCLPVGGVASSLRSLERPPVSSESRGRCQLDHLRPSVCRQQKRRRVRVSSSSRTDDYEDDLLLARLEDHAACAKLSLSELRCPTGKLRTSDMFVGGGRRCRSADVIEVARNVVIWVLVLSGTATIMFGAVGIIVLRTGSVMFLSSAIGSALTTIGVLMAIYCTDASSDRGLQRMINHKYNYT
ncbi:hypothetical protein HPB50_016579 [Hyalomma asiaticum]|uniref:Uncharacterized protein n=1 Tax=Hyalomma asiaticum TaxID=266040 RepID=A0ACB7SXB9_HYAAI|nr:hypothetical protein HPB50_016579 [Hyalomma asiaticum]